jgi:hypothetical protein
LVSNELHTIWTQSEILAREGRSPERVNIDRFLPSELWRRHREVLADGPEDQWRQLAVIYDSIESMRWVILQHEPGDPFPEERRERIRKTSALVADVYEEITGERPDDDG